jgi:cardiolipin synthase A/B
MTLSTRTPPMIHWPTLLISVLATLVLTLVYQNWTGGERRIEQQLPKLYETDDADFRRALSALLGPQIVEGNDVQTLINGEKIFPAMLEGIRSAQHTITF